MLLPVSVIRVTWGLSDWFSVDDGALALCRRAISCFRCLSAHVGHRVCPSTDVLGYLVDNSLALRRWYLLATGPMALAILLGCKEDSRIPAASVEGLASGTRARGYCSPYISAGSYASANTA